MTDLLEPEVSAEQDQIEQDQAEAQQLPPPSTSKEIASKLRQETCAVRLQRGKWGVSKRLDAAQVAKAAEAFAADSRYVGGSKKLINRREKLYCACTKILSEAVGHWKAVTTPYPEDGIRLIRRDRIEQFNAKMVELRDRLAAAALELDQGYQQIVDDAREKLGELFSAADYPGSVAHLFRLEWDFPSVEPAEYLKQLSPALYQQEQERVAARFAEAVALAEASFAEQFQKLVAHLADSLTIGEDGKQKKFHASNIENLKEFFERFRALNVGSNAELDALVSQAQELVGGVDAKTLRTNEVERASVQEAMAGLAGKLDALLVVKSSRAIDLSDEE